MQGISYETKRRIIFLKESGRTLKKIAFILALSFECVRFWYRQYRDKGESGLISHSHKPMEKFDEKVREIALQLKREHKNWGAKVILTKMRKIPELKGLRLPSVSQLYVYYNSLDEKLLRDYNKDKLPSIPPEDKATQPNECWQIDFKEKVLVENVGKVSILNIRDEGSALTVGSHPHQAEDTNKAPSLTSKLVIEDLRFSFEKRGLPDKIRTDRGTCFVGHPELKFPSRLTLWLCGLHVEHIINKPHCPKQNAEVERYNQTYQNMFLKEEKVSGFQHLLKKSDEFVDFLNEEYPTNSKNCKGKPPIVVNPEIYKKRRFYSKESEIELFDINRVKKFISTCYWERSVGANFFTFLSKSFRIPKSMNIKKVCITYNKEKNVFTVSTKNNEFIKEIPATFINVKELTGLNPPS